MRLKALSVRFWGIPEGGLKALQIKGYMSLREATRRGNLITPFESKNIILNITLIPKYYTLINKCIGIRIIIIRIPARIVYKTPYKKLEKVTKLLS